MSSYHPIDLLDKNILRLCIEHPEIHHKVIAEKLEVSNATIHVRMTKLKELGIILGNELNIDVTKLGFNIIAFIGIFLDKASDYKKVISSFNKIKEVIELHYCTGNYSIFAKIVCKDTQELRAVLHEKIQDIEGIQRTETFISLEQSIKRNISL